MGKEFYNLTQEQLCDLMCGKPERDYDRKYKNNARRKNGKKFKEPGKVDR